MDLPDGGQRTKRVELTGIPSGTVTVLAFAPDSRTLAVGLDDGSVRLVDPATRTTRTTLRDPMGLVADRTRQVGFSPDGRWVVSIDRADGVRLWDTRTGDLVDVLRDRRDDPHPGGAPTDAAFSPDSGTLAVLRDDGSVRLRPVGSAPPERQVELTCAAVGRDLTEREWSTFLPGRPYRHSCTGR